MRLLLAALAVFLSVSAAQAQDRYNCLPISQAREWHQSRGHQMVAERTAAAANGYPVHLSLFKSPDGEFFTTIWAFGAPDVCLIDVSPIDPRLIDPAGMRL